MTKTGFFVELDYGIPGTTQLPKGVYEMNITFEGGRELLTHANLKIFSMYPKPVFRSDFGGWINVNGPARSLTMRQWRTLIRSEGATIVELTRRGSVMLKNGATMSLTRVMSLMNTVLLIRRENKFTFRELVELCQNPDHELYPGDDKILLAVRLVRQDRNLGRVVVNEDVRNFVLSMIDMSTGCMRFVNPRLR